MGKTEFESKLRGFVDSLKTKNEFNRLSIEINVSSISQKELCIKDNSALWLPNSYTALSEITKFAKEIYINERITDGVLLTIKFGKGKENVNQSLSEQKSLFVTDNPKYKLDDVILPEETKDKIKEAIATIENFDIVYNQWNFKSKEPSAKTNICFFGVPGTGKTMCAHAIANSLNKKILIASYADIQSEYVGVGPKNLKMLFQQAESENALLL